MQPEPLVYLTLVDPLAMITAELGDPRSVIADVGLLEAAVHRPGTDVFGIEAYPGVHAKAAALLHSLVTSHPLVDGNKRLGALSLLVFYGLNGLEVTATDDQLYDLIIAIADGSEREAGKIAADLAAHTPPMPA